MGSDSSVDFRDDGELLAPDEPVNLSNCDREPIHIPGAIQPFGILLAIDSDWRVRQLSANASSLVDRSIAELVDQPLAEIVGEAAAQRIVERAGGADADSDAPLQVTCREASFDAFLHRSDDLLVCELEATDSDADRSREPGSTPQGFEDDGVGGLSHQAAAEIRQLTGYDRVMVYRFDIDGHGEVVAEAADERLDSFLGHHYPATDIPRQARALYLRQLVRMIVDVNYEPSPIVPDANPMTGAPLDLSLSQLRSVSPIHLEYLRNMGVTATLVVSLVIEDRLWGLIACHHYAPHHPDHATRTEALHVGQVLAERIVEQEERALRHQFDELTVLSRQLLRLIGNAPSAADGLRAGENLLLELGDADGATIVSGGERQRFGVVPTIEDERQIVAMLPDDGGPLVMDRLTRDLPFVSHNTDMCGVLAMPLGSRSGDYVIWYRDEWVHDLTWGGDPGEVMRPDLTSTNLKSLSPRRSFEAWRQAVVGRSQPWLRSQIEAAQQFRDALAELL